MFTLHDYSQLQKDKTVSVLNLPAGEYALNSFCPTGREMTTLMGFEDSPEIYGGVNCAE